MHSCGSSFLETPIHILLSYLRHTAGNLISSVFWGAVAKNATVDMLSWYMLKYSFSSKEDKWAQANERHECHESQPSCTVFRSKWYQIHISYWYYPKKCEILNMSGIKKSWHKTNISWELEGLRKRTFSFEELNTRVYSLNSTLYLSFQIELPLFTKLTKPSRLLMWNNYNMFYVIFYKLFVKILS